MNPLPTLTEARREDARAWTSALDEHGVVVVEEWARPETLTRMESEHYAFFAAAEQAKGEVGHYRPGTTSRAIRLEIGRLCAGSAHKEFLLNALLHEVAGDYLGPEARINQVLYLTLDLPDPIPVTYLHYDRKHALKAFVCLSEATAEYGAPKFVPASHRHGRATRLAGLAAGIPIVDLPITAGHDGWEPVSVDAPAGTLILFDTDCLHMGGEVRPGRVRRVARGHSHRSALA